jgi:methylmalonyl-CoA mutase N-terminal domain/subunit
MDETLALPTEKAVRIALRTQQILAYETGIPNSMDPLAGSYYLESLTNQLEVEAEEIFRQVDGIGGVVPGIEAGWFQKRIADSAFRQQTEAELGQRKIVGVNDFTEGSDSIEIDTLSISPEIEGKQKARMARLRAERDEGQVRATLVALEAAAGTGSNLVDPILECARAYCTLFEIREAMEKVFGSYKEPVFF